MAPRSIRIAVAGLLGVFVVGCAGESDSPTRPTDAVMPSTAEDPATVTTPNVDRYLLRVDEGAGLHPLSPPQTVSGEPFPLPEGGAAVLERSGYISMAYQTGQGDSIAGVSSVLVFENEAGARDWMTYEMSGEVLRHELPDGKFAWFEVPDVAGATGWTGPDRHGKRSETSTGHRAAA